MRPPAQHRLLPPATGRLIGFLLLSAGLHALASLGWPDRGAGPDAVSPPTLQLQLVHRPTPPAAAPLAAVPAPTARAEPVRRPARPAPRPTRARPERAPVRPPEPPSSAVAARPAVAPAREAIAAAPATAADQPAPPAAGAAAQARLRLTLLDALRHHLVYPRLARQRGWEGTVLLAFDLTAAGTIEAVRVAQSSGHRILDLAASRALSQLGPVALEVKAAQGITLPVIFSLTDG